MAIRTVAKGCPPLLTLIGIDFHCFAPPRYCQAASKPCQAALFNIIRLLSEALKSAFHCSKKGSCWQLELSQGCLPLWTLIGIDFHCFATHQNLFFWDEPALPSYSDIIRLLSKAAKEAVHCSEMELYQLFLLSQACQAPGSCVGWARSQNSRKCYPSPFTFERTFGLGGGTGPSGPCTAHRWFVPHYCAPNTVVLDCSQWLRALLALSASLSVSFQKL